MSHIFSMGGKFVFSSHLPSSAQLYRPPEMKTCSLFWGSVCKESVLEPRREPKAAGWTPRKGFCRLAVREGPFGKQAGRAWEAIGKAGRVKARQGQAGHGPSPPSDSAHLAGGKRHLQPLPGMSLLLAPRQTDVPWPAAREHLGTNSLISSMPSDWSLQL